MKNRYDITIAGIPLTINSDKDIGYIEGLIGFIEEKMKQCGNVDVITSALMANLIIADELYRLIKEKEDLIVKSGYQIKKIESALSNVKEP